MQRRCFPFLSHTLFLPLLCACACVCVWSVWMNRTEEHNIRNRLDRVEERFSCFYGIPLFIKFLVKLFPSSIHCLCSLRKSCLCSVRERERGPVTVRNWELKNHMHVYTTSHAISSFCDLKSKRLLPHALIVLSLIAIFFALAFSCIYLYLFIVININATIMHSSKKMPLWSLDRTNSQLSFS